MKPGILTISLDVELHWGVLPTRSVAAYRRNLEGERLVIPELLELFRQYGVRATWAVVGLLFFSNRDELLAALPTERPNYVNPALSPYVYIECSGLGRDESDDPFHFAPSLVRLLASDATQEIATHTFSHYYCLEAGQDANTFAADLDAALTAAASYGLTPRTLVFPRNQFNREYTDICVQRGVLAYRGNEPSIVYRPRPRGDETKLIRLARLADAYVPITSGNSFPTPSAQGAPVNVRSSRFLRPVSSSRRALEPLRLRRLKQEMSYAALHGHVYHLWWHPHNFGAERESNLRFLRRVLDHYRHLAGTAGMLSATMSEVAALATSSP